MSAAVDGMVVAEAVISSIMGADGEGRIDDKRKTMQKGTGTFY